MKRKLLTYVCSSLLLLTSVVGCKKTSPTPVTLTFSCNKAFNVGDTVNKSDIEVKVVYSDDSSKSVSDWTSEMFSTSDSYTFTKTDYPTKKTTINYQGLSEEFVFSIGEELTFEQRLKNLDGVTSVTKIDEVTLEMFDECYTVKMKQNINWDNPSLGTFEQKFNVYYKKDSKVTQYYCGGYSIRQDVPTQFHTNELRERYSSSVVDLEYRFFGNSCPTDFDKNGTKYYEYLNSYQACKDFNHIISNLQTIFKNKTIFTGGSKGGYTTETMAYYNTNLIDAFVSYVAPLCNGTNDANFVKHIYTVAGNKTYGETVAEKYRDIIKTFQIQALSEALREKIKSFLPKTYADLEAVKLELLTEDEVYEMIVLETGVGIWQYYGSTKFEGIETINNMPTGTPKDQEAKAKAVAEVLSDFLVNDDSYRQYYVQAHTEMGNYLVDFSYLRNAGAQVNTKENRDSLLNDLVNLTKVQRDKFTHSSAMRDKLINFFNTTTKDIIKIVGNSDPWYGVKAPVTENKKIHLYEAKGNHGAKIDSLEEAEKAECFGIIDKLLDFTPAPSK